MKKIKYIVRQSFIDQAVSNPNAPLEPYKKLFKALYTQDELVEWYTQQHTIEELRSLPFFKNTTKATPRMVKHILETEQVFTETKFIFHPSFYKDLKNSEKNGYEKNSYCFIKHLENKKIVLLSKNEFNFLYAYILPMSQYDELLKQAELSMVLLF